jgi:hypothetical protein
MNKGVIHIVLVMLALLAAHLRRVSGKVASSGESVGVSCSPKGCLAKDRAMDHRVGYTDSLVAASFP